jgi:hypothetical protein
MAALAVASLVSTGCEDTPLTAGADYTISVIAQPGTVVINPAQGIDTAQATILATVLDAESVPQQGITVFFTSEGGSLTSGANGVKTNASGIAIDVLTVTADDPDEVVVTAISASLTDAVTVTKNSVTGNLPPTAAIVASPSGSQASGKQVIFDGSASSDPDEDDFITMYKWVITSTNHSQNGWTANPFVAEGPGVSGVSFPSGTSGPLVGVQDLNVTLLVTDDPNAPAQFTAGQPIAYRAQQTLPYAITTVRCSDNIKPTAVIAGGTTQQIFGGAGTQQTFNADGSLSSDPETAIETYTWNCGNGTIAQPGATPSRAVCTYIVDGVPRTYTVTLVVTDRGTGQLVNGEYECAADSVPASIQLVVSPLAGG